jgi:putative zinc finger/helix-turn-helix YgiT family protein
MSHNCVEHRKEHIATDENPYHFTDSGLSYVYLVGIRYFTCDCGVITAEIPAVKQLMQLIARDTIAKPAALTGEEVKFLRKRLGQKQTDFARAIGMEPETLSRYENNHQAVSEGNDKLIRFYFIFEAKEDIHLEPLRKAIHELLLEWKATAEAKKIVAKVTPENEWQTERRAA